MRKLTAVLLLLIFSSTTCVAQDSPKQTIDRFLSAWLVKKDMASVQRNFSRNAFSNKLLWKEDCAPVVEAEDRRNPIKVRRKVINYLRYMAYHTQGRNLSQILKFDWNGGNTDMVGGKRLSNISQNGYALSEASKLNAFIDDEIWNYIKSKYPSKSYLLLFLFVKVKYKSEIIEYPVYFFWAKEGGVWKIIQNGTECV